MLETLEDRTVPSGLPPAVVTALPDTVLGPNELTEPVITVQDGEDLASTLQWEAKFGTEAYLLDLQLELQAGTSYYYNWSGLKEKWLFDGDGAWHYILPNGELHRWRGPMIAILDPIYYFDPSLLSEANNPGKPRLHQESLDMAFVLDTQLNLSDPNDPAVGGLWENWAGKNERWIKGETLSGKNAWYYILPNGEFYSAGGTLYARLLPTYYQVDMIQQLTNSGGIPAPNPPTVTVEFANTTSATFENTLTIEPVNYRGKISVQLIIRDDGADDPQPGQSRIFDVTFLNHKPLLQNPGTIDVPAGESASFDLISADVDEGDTLTFDVDFAPDFLPDLTYWSKYDNYYGTGERWYSESATGKWYFVNRTGDLFQWNGGRGSATGLYLGKVPGVYDANPGLVDTDTEALPAGFTGTISVTDAGRVTVNMPAGFAGYSFVVIAEVKDGMNSTYQRFIINAV